MNICVLFALLLLLAPGGCPIYSIDLSTLEVPNDFQNELTLQSMLSSELHQYRNKLNEESQRQTQQSDIEERIKATYAATDPKHKISTSLGTAPTKLTRRASDSLTFMGTNLFGNYLKNCFSAEDIALISARRDFEALLPKSYPITLLNDRIVYAIMKYFNTVNQIVLRKSHPDTKPLLQRAFYDAFGSYLHYYLLPVAQVSYYAGKIKLCTVERLVKLYRQCKLLLNTNGNNWKTPSQNILSQLHEVHIEHIALKRNDNCEQDASSCAMLDQSCINEDVQSDLMIVPLPRLETVDSDGLLTNIFLPFKQRRIYNLRSPSSEHILVKFFKTVSECYRFQGISSKVYNMKLRAWIREALELHYRDEMFYPGLGGVIQIYETLGSPQCTRVTAMPADEQPKENLLCEDYPQGADDSDNFKPVKGNNKTQHMTTNSTQVENKSKERQKSKIKSGKKSRSAQAEDPQSQQQSDATSTPDQKLQLSSSGDQCIDCDDDNYVTYIAVGLALLLLLLLIIICCCVFRNSKRRRLPPPQSAPPPPPKEKEPPAPVEAEEKTDVEAAAKEDRHKKSCWGALFGKKQQFVETEKRRLLSSPHLSPGMSLVSSRRERLSYKDREKLMPQARQQASSYDFDDDSMTSTSSLGCQFHRKLIPLKASKEKRNVYYAKAESRKIAPVEHKRSLQKAKSSIVKDKVNESLELKTSKTTDLMLHRKSTPVLHKRTEGGMANSRLHSGPKPSNSESSLSEETNERSLYKKQPNRRTERNLIEENFKDRQEHILAEHSNTSAYSMTGFKENNNARDASELADNSTKSVVTKLQDSVSTEQIIEPLVRHATSWETTYDEDDDDDEIDNES
ncbi:uncharacterized protein LOC108603395 isoform X2 [Drosophila busckii]|uniref:uncharacterized protein LOC108603395 isoform X2 n=1 Tax=Drosophila busckii TaxID=30019 RepID=UPI00083F2DE5|nr:uncharacterized protein LOC108603395 isoform X2 [Drosophila busckii]